MTLDRAGARLHAQRASGADRGAAPPPPLASGPAEPPLGLDCPSISTNPTSASPATVSWTRRPGADRRLRAEPAALHRLAPVHASPGPTTEATRSPTPPIRTATSPLLQDINPGREASAELAWLRPSRADLREPLHPTQTVRRGIALVPQRQQSAVWLGPAQPEPHAVPPPRRSDCTGEPTLVLLDTQGSPPTSRAPAITSLREHPDSRPGGR
jgi:hypothetical protein